MAVVQSNWATAPDIGYPGMVANGETSNRVSRNVADASGLAFGKFGWRGTGDRDAVIAATAGTIIGVCIADHGLAVVPGGVAADIVPQGRTTGFMTKGAIYVTAGANCADGDQVYVTPTGGTITPTSASNIIAPGWFFDDTALSGAIVRIVNRG